MKLQNLKLNKQKLKFYLRKTDNEMLKDQLEDDAILTIAVNERNEDLATTVETVKAELNKEINNLKKKLENIEDGENMKHKKEMELIFGEQEKVKYELKKKTLESKRLDDELLKLKLCNPKESHGVKTKLLNIQEKCSMNKQKLVEQTMADAEKQLKLNIAETEKEELKKKSYEINDLIRKFQYIKRNDTLQNEELVELCALEQTKIQRFK